MTHDRSLFPRIFETLYALRKLVLVYFAMNCAVSIADTWIEDDWLALIANISASSVFSFFFFCHLLSVSRDRRVLETFIRYTFWYSVLLYGVGIGGSTLLDFWAESMLDEFQERSIYLLLFLLANLFVVLAPYYFFGTLMPAKIYGKQDTVRISVGRAMRQSGYFAPRFLGIFVPLSVPVFVLSATVTSGLIAAPISLSGEVNPISLAMVLILNGLDVLLDSVFMVIATTAYLKDLRERGEIPSVDAEVFA